MFRKLKLSLVSLLFLCGAVVPVVATTSALAATTQKPGTCFYSGPLAGSKTGFGHKTASCKSLGITTKNKDSSGKAINLSNCYEVAATTSTSIITRVNCNDTPLNSSAPVIMCDVNGKSVPCPTTGDTHDSAIGSGNCSKVDQGCDLISKYLQPFINFLAALVGVVVVISVVIGGIQYSTSAGDPQKASAARARIRNAIIALITFIFLYGLLNFLIPGGIV